MRQNQKEELPMFFGVKELMQVLGISRTTAYALANTEGFPCGRIGTRIVINRDLFLEWIENRLVNKSIIIHNYNAKGENRLGA